MAIQAGNVHAAQAWILLESLLMDVVPDSIAASLPTPGKVDSPPPLVHSTSAPSAIPSIEGVGVHNTGPTSKPNSYRAMSADSAINSIGSPHSPSQSRTGHHHSPAPRSVSVNGATSSTVSASNEDRKHVRHRPEAQLPLPTKPPPNSRNLTPASSASSSPRHVPVSLPPTPALPPTTTMTPTTVSQRRPSILVSTASKVHAHARRSSVYNRGTTSAQSVSPSVASASDRSMRHVGEGALDDSDSSDGDGTASESVAESHAGEVMVDHLELAPPPPKPIVVKSRSISAGRAGPAHPSPLSRLAGQQQWVEDEEDEELGPIAELGMGMRRLTRPVDEEDASPSPVSSDTDEERSDEHDSEGEEEVRPQRPLTMKSRSRSRKNSGSRRFKSRSRSSTVASLAAATPMVVSPARSSPSRPPPTSSLKPLLGVLGRTGSQSSVQTVIAASIREQESEVGVDSGKDLVGNDSRPASWAEMSHQRRVTIVEEERQLREAGWRALREALEEYADEVGSFGFYMQRMCGANEMVGSVRATSKCVLCLRWWLPRSSS